MAPELETTALGPSTVQPAPDAPRPRRCGPGSLAFGLAFLVFGALGLLRAFGAPVPSAWLYPVILIGLGAAGLSSLFLGKRC